MRTKLGNIFFALILLVPGSILIQSQSVQVQATTGTTAALSFKVFAIGALNTIHELPLKATQSSNGQVKMVSGFTIAPENVVQLEQGDNLMVFTSTNEPERIEKVKVRDSENVVTELVYTQGFSLKGLKPGVYVLDAIVDSPTSSNKDAYETILVILAPNQPPIKQTEITKIINKVVVKIRIDNDRDGGNDNKTKDNQTKPPTTNNTQPSVCYFNPDDPQCDPVDGKCPSGWALNEAGQCHPGGKCPDGYARVNDDETGTCYAESKIKRCDNGAIMLKEDDCSIYDPEPQPGNDTAPVEEETPGGQNNTNNQNELIAGPIENEEPEVCTPNGPPCPPCPEGVEAGWCADEDEQEDTGDGLVVEEPEVEEEEEEESRFGGGSADDSGSSDSDDNSSNDEESVFG